MTFQPGDPWPRITASSSDRQEVDLAHQTRAGRTTLNIFLGPDKVNSVAAVLGTKAAEIGGDYVFNLILKAPPPGTPSQDGPIKRFYFEDAVAQRLIGLNEGVALVDRMGRLRRIGALGDLRAILDAAEALEREFAHMVAPVLILEDILEPDMCARLIAHWNEGPKLLNAVAAQKAGNASANAEFKRRADVVCKDKSLMSEISRRIEGRVLPEIARIFRTRIIESELFRIGCYDEANLGGFRRHRDNTTRHTAHRAFAVSLNLNEPTYEGGEVIFPEFGDRKYRPGQGGAVVFSCGLLHEALPVTRGRRFGLFTFLVDEHGRAAAEQARGHDPAPGYSN